MQISSKLLPWQVNFLFNLFKVYFQTKIDQLLSGLSLSFICLFNIIAPHRYILSNMNFQVYLALSKRRTAYVKIDIDYRYGKRTESKGLISLRSDHFEG